jgi:hypothetical protein
MTYAAMAGLYASDMERAGRIDAQKAENVVREFLLPGVRDQESRGAFIPFAGFGLAGWVLPSLAGGGG